MERILGFVKISDGMRILDLGTGSGYLSFPIAKNNSGGDVIGLDKEKYIKPSRVFELVDGFSIYRDRRR